MKGIRLMLVDDHEVIRAGLKSFLQTQEEFEVVAEAGNGEEAVRLALATHPDVILMDITMPGMDGMEATRRLRSLCPDCLILALTVHDDKLQPGQAADILDVTATMEKLPALHAILSGQAETLY